MRQPCLGQCGNLVTKPVSRCPACKARANRARGTTAQRGYGQEWRKQSKAIVAAWVQRYGYLCVGWDTPPHESLDLVVDHDVGVLCRRCNSRKAGSFDKKRRR